MGLIKTAIMTGGGLYAVNKLAKTVESRHNSPSPNNQNYPRDNGYENGNQGYWGPPGQPPRGPAQERQWYPANNQNDPSAARGYSSGDYEGDRYQNAETDYQYQSRNRQALPPPSYYPQQSYAGPQDQVYDQSYDQSQNRRRGSPDVASLGNMAMDFVGRKDSGSKGKGSKMISEFLGK